MLVKCTDLSSLVDTTLHDAAHTLLGLRGNEGAKVCPRLVSSINLSRGGTRARGVEPRSRSKGYKEGVAAGQLTLSDCDLCTSSGIQFLVSPTKMAVDKAMQRCPAAPKAAPTNWGEEGQVHH